MCQVLQKIVAVFQSSITDERHYIFGEFFYENDHKDLDYNPGILELSLIYFIITKNKRKSRQFLRNCQQFFNTFFKA